MPEPLITSDPKIMMGKPVIAGTRITVELILKKLAAGETAEQILSEHQRLTPEGIRAAIAFADSETKLKAVRRGVAYSFPGADIEQMLNGIERGYES